MINDSLYIPGKDAGANKGSRLTPALQYMEDNLRETPSLGEMAGLCHLSVSYFSRLFHKEMGISFVNYVNLIKVRHACQRLESSEKMQISALAEELGFSDASYFIRIFKKIVGVTPNQYRKRCRVGK